MTGDTLRRIAVFGISRAGKDYIIDGAINRLTQQGEEYRHISMIGTVQALLNGRKLKEMDYQNKLKLMDEAHSKMDSESASTNIIVDEHYCFPKYYGGKIIHSGYVDEKLPFKEVYDDELEMVYEVVFNESELKKYDSAFFLDIDPSIILERFRTSEGGKANYDITLTDVRNWILFEKYNLKRLCAEAQIPFHRLINPETSSNDLALGILSITHYV